MVKVRIQLPLNISRGFEEILRDHFDEEGLDKYPADIAVENSHSCGSKNEKETGGADIMIGFLPELMMQTGEYTLDHLIRVKGRFPVRNEIQEGGFVDPLGCFQTFGIVPFIMFYNPDVLDESEIPRTWNALLDPKWKGRIMMPGKEHMASKVIRSVLNYDNPGKTQAINENLICQGMPPNVIDAVKRGDYALGIANITFGKISESQQIRMIWPEDGLLCMPQIIAWKKGLDERLLKLGDFMLSPKIQNYLIQQTFIPASPEADIPELFKTNHYALKWNGWADFREAMRNCNEGDLYGK